MTFDVLKNSKNIPTDDELRQIEEIERNHDISSSLSQFNYIDSLKGIIKNNGSIYGSRKLSIRR